MLNSIQKGTLDHLSPGLSGETMAAKVPVSYTCTACLSAGMMLREVEGAWVHTGLLELAVAMVMTADVVGLLVATFLFVSVCFSPGLCFSISQVTHRFSKGKPEEIKT